MTDTSISTSLQPGYILHHREYQESSLIVDGFSLAQGRIALLAKSARGSRPAVRALYQPFRPLLLSWVGSGELRTLTGIEEAGPPINLSNARLACGYYINELLLRLLGKDQPQERVFAFYALALADLEQAAISYETVLRTFELQLLDVLGVLPDLRRCTADGSEIIAEREYLYHPANALAVPVQGSTGLGLLKEKHRMGDEFTNLGGKTSAQSPSIHPDGQTSDDGIRVHGKTLIAMDLLEFNDEEVIVQCRTLMRHILRVQLGERPLKSRELFAALAGSGRAN
jgi:DNA repair protein RecO (recombination protein O)